MKIRNNLKESYSDVYTPEVLSVLSSMEHFNNDIKEVMASRIERRAERQTHKMRITFPDPESTIPRTTIKVKDAREGKFEGSVIPADLQLQCIQCPTPSPKHNTHLS